jgi:dTDP-4-dehydrorhamnose 3,5-epimerase-like enzyme
MNNSDTSQIFGFFIRIMETERSEGTERWHVLVDSDHLLRRFGELELIRMTGGDHEQPFLREQADEIIALIEGNFELRLRDHRPESPSCEATTSLNVSEPSIALIPAGVVFGIKPGDAGATFLRITTHARSTSPNDRSVDWGEL